MKNNITKRPRNWKRNVENVLRLVRRKYSIFGKFSMDDFHTIRKGEGIELLDQKYHDQIPFPDVIKGALLFAGNGRKIIFLRKSDDILTAMHELGHFYLPHEGILLKADIGSKPHQEVEADYFAELSQNCLTKVE